MSVLEENNIRLRALEPSDLTCLYEWENNSDFWLVSQTIQPFSEFVLKKYLQSSHNDIYTTKQLRLVIELIDSKTPIGFIDLFEFDPYNQRAGVGILIANKNEQHKGYAATALNILCNYAQNVLHLHQLYCDIAVDNVRSLQLFTKAQFEVIGTKKQWQKTASGWKDEYSLQRIF